MHFLPLPDAAARQLIDSHTVFTEWLRVQKLAHKYRGGMYWKKQGDYEYLVKTAPDNSQQRIGTRNAETEKTYHEFCKNKAQAEERLASIRQQVRECERLNKALQVGRAPNVLIEILQTLHDAGLQEHFVVVGTHALYAYEMAAAVRIVPSALATQDIDLLWDARKRVRFMSDMKNLDTSVLRLLQKVDKTFERKEGQNETAINAKGFEVDFLRRQPVNEDPHPFRFSSDENDLWPVQAVRGDVLTQAARFERMVVSNTGRMALMTTIDPHVFASFKTWLSQLPQREPAKKRRDATQAAIVQSLLDEGLLLAS